MKVTTNRRGVTNIEYAVIGLIIIAILTSSVTMFSVTTTSSSIKQLSENMDTISSMLEDISSNTEDISSNTDNILEKLEVEQEPEPDEPEPDEPEPTPPTESPLIVGSTSELGGPLTPLWVHGGNEMVVEQIFEGLVQYKIGTTQLEPVLATNLGETEDAKKWTFYLRRGIKFHDGTEFNAQAVKEHFDNSFETNAGLTYLYTAALLTDSRTTNSVVVVDDYTIEFNLNIAANVFPKILANFASYIESPASVEKYGLDGINEHPVGTGPFTFVSQSIGEEVVVEANQDWWRLKTEAGEAKVDIDKIRISKIIFKRIADPSTLRFAIETGSIDFTWTRLNPADYPDLLANPDLISFDTSAIASLRILTFAGDPSLFSTFTNVKMRQAFSYAIDYNTIVDAVFEGLAERIYSYMPPEYEEYKATARYKYDPEKAKALIQEAGFEIPVKCKLSWTPEHYGITERDIVTIIKASALEAGFDVDISDSPDYATYKANRPIMEMSLWGWSADYPDQDAFTTPFMYSKGWTSASKNFNSHLTDFGTMIETVDPLVEEAISTADSTERKDAIYDLQDIYAEWIPTLFMFRTKRYSFASNDFKGIVFGPVGKYDIDFYLAYKTD